MRLCNVQHLEAFGTMLAALLAVALVASSTGRNVLTWVYLQSTQAMERGLHLPSSLDRMDPTCPECM